MLEPSLFGLLALEFRQWLFPKAPILIEGATKIPNPSMSILFSISQIGLVLYMFLIGLEFNTELLKHYIKSAGLLSGAGILTPFILVGLRHFLAPLGAEKLSGQGKKVDDLKMPEILVNTRFMQILAESTYLSGFEAIFASIFV